MYGPFDLIDKVKRFGRFSREEWKSILITIAAMSFIIGFNDGRGTAALDAYWFMHMGICVIVVSITVLVHLMGQKIYALDTGFKTEYKVWWYGILIGIVMAFVTRGHVWLLLPGGVFLHHLAVHRLGYFRYGTNTLAMAMIGLAGSIANILLATFIKTLDVWFGVPVSSVLILDKLILFCWAYALYNLLPIPPLNGAMVLFRSRLIYSFVFGSVLGYAVLVLLGIYSFILALLIGGIIWLIYYVTFEKGAWSGTL